NHRTDEYGGSLTNRLRFLDEVVTALCDAIGADRVGVRLAPLTTLNGTVDDHPEETYVAAAKLLNQHDIAYLHIAEADWEDAPLMPQDFKRALRDVFSGAIIYAGKYTAERAEQAVQSGLADLIGFGRPFVANPDLPSRIQLGQPWAKHDPDTLFGGAGKGLIDYPTYSAA
ncbi:MAG: alkene reductase, partial [Vibrio fluvialis]